MFTSKFQLQPNPKGRNIKFLSLIWTCLCKWLACKAVACLKELFSSDDVWFFFLNIELEKLLSIITYVFVLQQDCKFYLDSDIMFLNMGSLVEYYSIHVLPSHDSLILRCPYGYSKPRWHDWHNSLMLRTNGFPTALELNVDSCHCWTSHCLHTETDSVSAIYSHIHCI